MTAFRLHAAVHEWLLGRLERFLPVPATLGLVRWRRLGWNPMTVKQLSLECAVSNISDSLKSLRSAGLIRTHKHPNDGRVTVVEITDHGRELAKELEQFLAKWEEPR